MADSDQPSCSCQDSILENREDGADDRKGNERCYQNRAQRSDEQVKHLRHFLMQPFFHRTHQQYGEYDRNDVSLITDLLYIEKAQMPGRNLAGGVVSDCPRVDQSRMNHHQTDNRAQENIAAEHACSGDRNKNGKKREGCIRNQIEEREPVAGAESRPELRDCLDDTHHQTGRHDGRKDRNKYVAGRLQNLLPQRHLACRSCLGFILAGSGSSCHRKEFIIYLVNGTCTNDQLELSVGFEHTLDTVNILKGCLIDLSVVRNNEPQTCCAVRRADYIRSAAYIGRDLLSTFTIVQCHSFYSPSINGKKAAAKHFCRPRQVSG